MLVSLIIFLAKYGQNRLDGRNQIKYGEELGGWPVCSEKGRLAAGDVAGNENVDRSRVDMTLTPH